MNSPQSKEIIFTNDDYYHFREWIQLDLDGITWQGKFTEEFEDFWRVFFIDGLSIKQMIERFNYAYYQADIGPLTSWFNWLNEKFISYIFIFKNINLLQLSKESQIPLPHLANILRNFFLEMFPYLDDYLSDVFQVSNITNKNIYLTFDKISSEMNLPSDFPGRIKDDVMASIEVTLYEEWLLFLNKMKKELYHKDFNLKQIKLNASWKKQISFVVETALLLFLGFSLIFVVKIANEKYEHYLARAISVYAPQFAWLERSLTFKPFSPKPSKNFKLSAKELDEVDDAKQLTSNFEEERFETESEVIITSLDALPKNFNAADLEKSEYEEIKKRGYRESRYGHTKVYRVMMNSVDTNKARGKLEKLLSKYDVTQVDYVKPGTEVPGGIYYNLFVPRDYLKEFLAQVMDVDESTLYESRTQTQRNPPGKNKVFIWIKSF